MKSTFFGAATTALMAVSMFATSAQAAWDLGKKNNFMLYWGQNAHGAYSPDDNKQQLRLVEYCKNTDVDLISVGFVKQWTTADGHIEVNFSNQCGGTFPGASLLWCPFISEDIITCQQTYGKKILISLGGGNGDYTGFSTPAEAQALGQKLWNTFGKGWTYYRPFGEAVVDGFDFDIEKGTNNNYHYLAQKLRQLFATDSTKQYLLTAAPQCPHPDAHLDQALRAQAFDAIFVQYYNNPACAADKWVASGTSGFNYATWHAWIAASAKNKNMKIFLTLPGSGNVAPAGGYVSKDRAAQIATDLANKYPTTFAGVGMWDASEATANTGYIARVKTALNAAQGTSAKRSLFTGHARLHAAHRH